MRELIQSKFDEAIDYITNKRKLYSEIYDNPEIIITTLFNPKESSPYYDLGSKVLDKLKLSHHEIQKELERLLKNYIESIDPEVEVRLLKKNYYPSAFAIVYENNTILTFNVYEHIFGDFRPNESIELYDERINNCKNIINELESKIKQYQEWLDNPYVLLRGNYEFKNKPFIFVRNMILDTYYLLFRRHELENHLQKKIEYVQSEIENKKREILNLKQWKGEFVNKQSSQQKKFEEWRERFINWGYEEKERRSHELY
jgi:hypothetical protein